MAWLRTFLFFLSRAMAPLGDLLSQSRNNGAGAPYKPPQLAAGAPRVAPRAGLPRPFNKLVTTPVAGGRPPPAAGVPPSASAAAAPPAACARKPRASPFVPPMLPRPAATPVSAGPGFGFPNSKQFPSPPPPHHDAPGGGRRPRPLLERRPPPVTFHAAFILLDSRSCSWSPHMGTLRHSAWHTVKRARGRRLGPPSRCSSLDARCASLSSCLPPTE